MADDDYSGGSSEVIEGSDIDECSADDFIADPDFEPFEPIDRDLWMRDMFLDEGEDEDFAGFETEWRTDNYHLNPRRRFNRTPGVKVSIPADATPMEVFQHIFTDELWSHLVTETNIYSDQSRSTPSRAKTERWAQTVMVLSNHHDPTEMGTVNRRKEGASQSEVVVPACLADYQKHMKSLFDGFMFYGQKCKYLTIYYVLYIFQNYEKKVESLFSLLSFEQMCL